MLEETNPIHYLTFDIDKNYYAIEVGSVVEIIDKPTIKNKDLSLTYVIGNVLFRDKEIVLIDLHKKLNPFAKVSTKSNLKVIIAVIPYRNKLINVGLGVNQIFEIMFLDSEPSTVHSLKNSGLVKGLAVYEENFITVLNIKKLLSVDEISMLNELSPNLFTV